MPHFPADSVALVVGASRGIGRAWVELLLDRREWRWVHAACRDPGNSELVALQARFPARLKLHRLDVTDEASIQSVASTLAADGDVLDLLVNTAGLLHADDGMVPEKRLADVQPDALARAFAVNASGPLLLAKHFASLLRRNRPAVLANLSARVGSIGDNRLGGWYAYRMSKAAQNMATRTLAIELGRRYPGQIVVGLHPGTTDTALSKPFQAHVPEGKLFTAAYAVDCLMRVIERLGPEDSGQVFAWDGKPIVW